MNFESSEIEQELRSLARKFLEKELKPFVEEDEEAERFRPELIQKLGELGLTGLPLPEQLGGAGLGYQEYVGVLQELARVNTGYAISVAVTGLAQVILATFGNEEQKEKYIPALAGGQMIGSFSLSEAGSGSDAASLRTVAKKVGDHYVLTGTKMWVTQANHAGVILLMARTGEAGPQGISTFIVEKDTPGLKMGKREKKMGWSTSHTMEILLDQARVPARNLVGNLGDGFKIAMNALDSGRITIGACALGIARGAIDLALSHCHNREQFGKPIGEFQGMQFMLADMEVAWEQASLLVQKAAWLRDHHFTYTKEASMAKLAATDMAMKVTTDAVQILGGSGYTREFPAERYMREAKAMQIVEGTNQIQRMVIGRHLLKESRP